MTRTVSDNGWQSELREQWTELLASSATATPFQSWEWCSGWWNHFGRGKQPHIFLASEGGVLIGLMPMFRSAFPWRTLRTMGTGHSDYLHPLARAGYEERFAEMLSEHLLEASKTDLVDLQQIRETEAIATKLRGAKRNDTERCYVLDLPGTWDEYLKTLGKSLKYEAKRLDKAPYTTDDAAIKTLDEPSEIAQGLDSLFRLHARRWKKRGLPGAFALKNVRAFHHEFAQKAAEADMLRLSVLQVQGQTIGAVYCMKLNGGYYFYQSGFDPSYKILSPGTVLVAHSIREAIGEGMARFDFMRGDEPYKLRWKPQQTVCNVRLLKSLTMPMGNAGQAINRLRGRIEEKVRDRFAGRGLIG